MSDDKMPNEIWAGYMYERVKNKTFMRCDVEKMDVDDEQYHHNRVVEQLQEKIGQAYIVIGNIVGNAEIDSPSIQNALDYFSSDSFDPDFLPFDCEDMVLQLQAEVDKWKEHAKALQEQHCDFIFHSAYEMAKLRDERDQAIAENKALREYLLNDVAKSEARGVDMAKRIEQTLKGN